MGWPGRKTQAALFLRHPPPPTLLQIRGLIPRPIQISGIPCLRPEAPTSPSTDIHPSCGGEGTRVCAIGIPGQLSTSVDSGTRFREKTMGPRGTHKSLSPTRTPIHDALCLPRSQLSSSLRPFSAAGGGGYLKGDDKI